jgi:23S rRNA (cytosine1962-C5)-methyltransferase
VRLDVERLWPVMPRGWLIDAHPDWLALAKPWGVPVQAGLATPSLPSERPHNELLARLRQAGQLAGLDGWLAFDPLDGQLQPGGGDSRDYSGVVVIARNPEAVAQLAGIEQQGGVRFTTVLGVEDWPAEHEAPARARLQRHLAVLGAHVVAHRRQPSRSAERSRTLVTLVHPGGRCIDWRIELDRAGLQLAAWTPEALPPVDGAKGGEGCQRWLLHRQSVQWAGHTLQAPLPPEFERWLTGQEPTLLERLESAVRRRFDLGHDPETTAFRLLDSPAEELTIDAYGRDLVLSWLVDVTPDDAPRVLREAREVARQVGERLAARAVYLKLRPRQANVVGDAVLAGLAPVEPVWGAAPAEIEALENGVRYRVRLGGALGTGIYLDQRGNRRWLRDHAGGLRVLNTFAYTCAFSVAAAVGGAARTVSLDASAGCLADGRYNLALNGFGDPVLHDTPHHDILRGDVFHWLPRLARRGDRFDLVVLDPPSYSHVKGGKRFAAAHDYPDLMALALSVLAPRGTLLCCTNHAGLDRRRFHQLLLTGAERGGRALQGIRHRPVLSDHPSGRMKSALVRFDD